MQVTFDTISKKKIVSQLIISSFNIAFGIVISLFLILSIPAAYEQGGLVFFFACCSIIVMVSVFCILPSFLIICAIRFYLFERKLSVLIDESTLQMQYITPTSTKVLSLQHVVSWKQYYNNYMGSFDLNILTFDNGEVIMFSNLLPLQKHIEKMREDYGLPKKELKGATYEFYQYLKFTREQETKNNQTQ